MGASNAAGCEVINASVERNIRSTFYLFAMAPTGSIPSNAYPLRLLSPTCFVQRGRLVVREVRSSKVTSRFWCLS